MLCWTSGMECKPSFCPKSGKQILGGICRPEVFDEIRKENLSEYGAWALVTGCTRGIGREYALGLARWGSQHFEIDVKSVNNVNRSAITCISLPFPPKHTSLHLSMFPTPFLKPWTRRGMNVMLVARDKKSLESLAVEVQALGVEAKVVVEDFTKEGAVDRVVNKVWKNMPFRLSCKTDHMLGGQPRAWGSREQRRGDGRPLYALPGHAAGGRRGHDQGQHHHSCGGELPEKKRST